MTPPRKIRVEKIPGRGRGVVATELIARGEVVERCPLVVLSPTEGEWVRTAPVLRHYALELLALGRHTLPLGYGMLYNHSLDPNAEIIYEAPNEYIEMVALRDIQAGEEVVFDYRFDDNKEDFL